MGRVTNRVASESLADLLAAPARATLAWIATDRPELLPVRYARDGSRHLVASGGALPPPGTPASLVLDDGEAWFALRAVTLRDAGSQRATARRGRGVAGAGARAHRRLGLRTPARGARRVTLDADARRLVADSPIALFGTRSPRGAPFLTPLWFVERGGGLYCATAASSVTVRNVGANGEAVLLLYPRSPREPGAERALRLRGRASVRRGRLPLGVLLAMARKYYASPRGLAVELAHARLWGLRQRYYAQSSPALLEFTPAASEWVGVPA